MARLVVTVTSWSNLTLKTTAPVPLLFQTHFKYPKSQQKWKHRTLMKIFLFQSSDYHDPWKYTCGAAVSQFCRSESTVTDCHWVQITVTWLNSGWKEVNLSCGWFRVCLLVGHWQCLDKIWGSILGDNSFACPILVDQLKCIGLLLPQKGDETIKSDRVTVTWLGTKTVTEGAGDNRFHIPEPWWKWCFKFKMKGSHLKLTPAGCTLKRWNTLCVSGFQLPKTWITLS